MRDVTRIARIICWLDPEVDLADAKYDGAINVGDITQTELIILGREKELTLIDMADRTVTVPRPIERIALVGMLNSLRTLVQLGAADKIVVTSTVVRYIYDEPYKSKYFSPLHRAAPELGELPRVDYRDPSLEVILTLEPDVILSYGAYSNPDTIQAGTGIPTVCAAKSTGGDLSFEQLRLIGWVVGKEERAEELISYVNEKLDELREVTSEIPDSEKPKVYVAHLGGGAPKDITTAMVRYDPVEIAGGINVARECVGGCVVTVSKEQIIKWNPDIILMGSNPSKEHRVSIEDVLSDPVLQSVNAVKNKKVYYTKGCMIGWDPATVTTEAFYFAKLFHPDKFKDLDVEETCNEILEKFYGVDGLYTEMAEKCDLYRWD
ncbi:MAG TPA: hypothetical protein ENI41_07080 [Deltaproteobacteria bacterium]|nr:hypothetical protein [Deltaproteobacteria bacterium]